MIDLAILIFKAENELRFKIAVDNPDNRKYLEAIHIALENCESVKNKEGQYIFSPYAVNKWQARKNKLLKKLGDETY